MPVILGWERLKPVSSRTKLPTKLDKGWAAANTNGEDANGVPPFVAAVAHSHLVGKASKRSDCPVSCEKSGAGEFPHFVQFGQGGTQTATSQWESGVSRQQGKTGGFLPVSLGSMKQEKPLTRVKSG